MSARTEMDSTNTKTRSKCITENCRNIGILTRPFAGNGFWLSILLTLSHTVNVWNRDKQSVNLGYKRSTILCFGLFLHSGCIFLMLRGRKAPRLVARILYTLLTIAITSFLFWICLNDNVVFSTTSGLFGIVLFEIVYFRVLTQLPKCFTLGEASIVCQGFIIFLYNAFLQVPRIFIDNKAMQETNTLRLILQVVLLGTGIIIIMCHFLRFLRGTVFFWLLSIAVISGTAMFPIFGKPTVIVLLQFILSDMSRIFVVVVYMLLLLVTSVFVIWQINRSTSVHTATRKIFHVFIVLVYLPGLWYQCTTLYVASGFMLALLILLEAARVIKLQPISEALDKAVHCFVDEKDAGLVALTPIYLLVGCSIPLWLHPVPCDLTDSAGLNYTKLLGGVLSVGIGDTMASVCGYYFGKHKWPGSMKSVEGTLASIAAQTITVFVLFKLSFIHINTVRAATAGVAIIANALVEAKTDQVDNLVLPLVTYIILGTS